MVAEKVPLRVALCDTEVVEDRVGLRVPLLVALPTVGEADVESEEDAE